MEWTYTFKFEFPVNSLCPRPAPPGGVIAEKKRRINENNGRLVAKLNRMNELDAAAKIQEMRTAESEFWRKSVWASEQLNLEPSTQNHF